MNETIRNLARMYKVSLNDALKALEEDDIIILSVDQPITDPQRMVRYSRVLAEIRDRNLSFHNDTARRKSGQKTVAEDQKVVNPANSRNNGGQRNRAYDLDERQKQLLSRDYVIFTHMSLRKSVTANILREVIEIKTQNRTKTQIVVCSETIDYVNKAAVKDNKTAPVAEALEILKKYKMLTILIGKVSEENHVISSFIRQLELSTSILIVGINRGLSTFVYSRNKNYQSNKEYRRIYERDVTAKGYLANPKNQLAAFEDPENKEKAPWSDSPLALKGNIPVSGEYVFYKQKNGYQPVLLEEEKGKGGEGAIYKVFSGTKCAKIFNAESNSEMKMKKIAIMCSKYSLLKSVDTPIMERIAWPEKVLFNEKEEPVGYIMNFFENTTPFSDFAYDTFEEIIPGVKKEHQVTMAVNFAELVDFMHHNNIILCDINRGNIMFDKELLAYLVDLDSAQIADSEYYYPSNVGFPEFRSPEHIYDNAFSFKRKKADDVWILQMLLFHILTPDGDPYATSMDYDDEREIVEKGYYPYQAGNNAAEDNVKGSIWHMIVSHFPKSLKQMFWESFNGKGKFFKESERRTSLMWLNEMVRYQENLPEMVKTDPESGKYMPESYRKYVQTHKTVDIKGGSLEELLKKFSTSGNRNWDDL